MPLDLTNCRFHGPALPEPFVKFELEKELSKRKLLRKTTGEDGKRLKEFWTVYRRKLQALAASGGALRVRNHVIEPLVELLGYAKIDIAPDVQTREDTESGGSLLETADGQAKLRVWTTSFDEDLYAPSKRGRAYRFSHQRIAQRVLLAAGERVGLLTNGVELLLLISDPARPDSTVTIPIDPDWKRSRDLPDSFLFLLALACPEGVAAVPDLVDKARLQQARVTKELRKQARNAIQLFIQEVLDHPDNREWFAARTDRDALARQLWREGLVIVYRLLFVLKAEAGDDPARSFQFASSSPWRNTYSPSLALAKYARDVLAGQETGRLLEDGLRALFRMLGEGLECTELPVRPLGGALFGAEQTPILSERRWGELAVARLLDQLLWTAPHRRGRDAQRERVHYGPLDVEDLGRVYEALLELEPGITTEPMCRLKRQKLEVVVPVAQGERYRPAGEPGASATGDLTDDVSDDEEPESDEEAQPTRGKKTKVERVEQIPPDRFYLRVGLGRKSSGSYYTPHSFVRFLVQETLGPQVDERCPQNDPQPLEILKLKVLDPAMGSGHFLVEACRFLGDKLYEACRLCDENALAAERRAEKGKKSERDDALAEARQWRNRIIDLPDPDDELLKYLPSRSPEGEQTGVSQSRAVALCRRLVAVHCLYGVDKNPLAVELAKLALWLESHAEGMPLTFLDHRLVVGDSLTGPFWEKLVFRPGKPDEAIAGLYHTGLNLKFAAALGEAIRYVRQLDAGVGITLAEITEKERTKAELDRALLPFRVAAAAWSGGVMLGPDYCDDVAYGELLTTIADTGDLPERIDSDALRAMIARGVGVDDVPEERQKLYDLIQSGACVPALPYDLTFPEVFYPTGAPHGRKGFHAAVGNPPWDVIEVQAAEVLSMLDPRIARGGVANLEALLSDSQLGWAAALLRSAVTERDEFRRITSVATLDSSTVSELSLIFLYRCMNLSTRAIGIVLPDAFHRNKEGAPVRERIFRARSLERLAGFTNVNRLFPDIPPVTQFDLIVLNQTNARTCERFFALFKSERDERLGTDDWIEYPWAFAESASPEHLTLLEVRSTGDAIACASAYKGCADRFATFSTAGIELSQEVNRRTFGADFVQIDELLADTDVRDDLNSRALLEAGAIGLLEGRSIQIYDVLWQSDPSSHWNPVPSIALPLRSRKRAVVSKVQTVLPRLRHYRLMARQTCGSPLTNERSAVFCLAPPGVSAVHSVIVESSPDRRPTTLVLLAMAVANSFVFDFLVRLQVGPNLSKFILETIPIPGLTKLRTVCVHEALRLSCVHSGFRECWREQLGEAWREAGKDPFTWPVLAGADERWKVRAAIDAVVADAYGLSRDQYAHVLSTFSHASYPNAPTLCLARFDELQQIGLEAFTKKHNPYWDIPLNENLPEPVIDLPLPEANRKKEQQELM